MIRLFRVFIPASVVGLLISEVFLVLGCYALASLFTTFLDPWTYLVGENNYWKVLLVVGLIILAMYFQDLYAELRVVSRLLLIQQVCLAVGSSLLIVAFLGYLDPNLLLGRWLMIAGSFAVILVLPLWRIFYWRYVIAVLRSERVLLLGSSSILGEVAETVLARPEFGYSILGYLCEEDPCGFPVPCLGHITDLKKICDEYKPTRIVVGMAERRNRLPVQELLEIRFGGVMIEDAADTYEVALRRVCSRKIQPSQLIFSSELGPRPHAIAIQSFYSFIIGVLGLVLLSPLMLLTVLLVWLTSKGPVLYRQRRVGVNGKIFTVFKFRSMYVDAEARTGAVWAKKDDPRITPVGKWLRKLRLDELPQMWNVVRGDMAIVGPRPERPEFVDVLAHQIPYYRQRLAVKPGITGWAQINHKYGDTELDAMIKLEYDLYYIKNVAAALDFYIIFHTVKVMLLSRGAQ
ncbi:MAG: TIGR03013 family PEP-CTERM/XrtA system glycosyltransferase [Acidobacteriota bacterium]|nr:TIGR03013 family PEP-CTERM/XrtA system glycosyltransferase [Acidobacteriota bacterium]